MERRRPRDDNHADKKAVLAHIAPAAPHLFPLHSASPGLSDCMREFIQTDESSFHFLLICARSKADRNRLILRIFNIANTESATSKMADFVQGQSVGIISDSYDTPGGYPRTAEIYLPFSTGTFIHTELFPQ